MQIPARLLDSNTDVSISVAKFGDRSLNMTALVRQMECANHVGIVWNLRLDQQIEPSCALAD
jgi:hypothetical protein